MFLQNLSLANEVLPEGFSKFVSSAVGIIAALGGIILLYLLFGILNYILERKKYKQIGSIEKRLKRIERLLKEKK